MTPTNKDPSFRRNEAAVRFPSRNLGDSEGSFEIVEVVNPSWENLRTFGPADSELTSITPSPSKDIIILCHGQSVVIPT